MLLALSRRQHTAVCFLCISLATLFLPITASAGDQENSTGTLADSEGLPPSFPQPPAARVVSPPRWTVSNRGYRPGTYRRRRKSIARRTRAGHGTIPQSALRYGDSAWRRSFQRQPVSTSLFRGTEISLTYHDESGYGAELSYFSILNQSATKTIGPDTPSDWLVMKAPGIFWQTQDFPYQGMTWSDTTNLYSAEANGQLNLSNRVTLIAGVRWLQLNDNLLGTLTPADRTAPTWKQTNPEDNLFQVTSGDESGWKLSSLLEYRHDKQSLRCPNRRGRNDIGV